MLHRLLLLACASCALFSTAAPAQTAKFPDQPIRMIVPFGPGGFGDITARLVAEGMGRVLGGQVIIDNRPGAGGVPAALATLGGKADGYTLSLYTNGNAISKSLYKKLPYDVEKDFAPVGLLAFFDLCILVPKDSKYKTLADLLADAKARPGKLNFASINPGSTQNLSAELFKSTAAIDVQTVPFKTSPDVLRALVGGDADFGIDAYAAMKSQIDSGMVRVLATTGPKRAPYLPPQVPTVKEAGVPTYEVVGWNALAVPAGTPPEIIAKLNDALNKATAMPEVKKRLLDLGAIAYAGTPSDMGKQLHNDAIKWADVIKKAHIPQQ
ncbi:MAG TPA: tripartite tricarboxylate transporter substrate binding protein [Burkholderiales bacterium]|jgi:tripartite-type tricarboxylate transporter receptor subunit TctC